MHLGRDRVIGAWEVDGVLIDPGPESCLETVLAALSAEPRALLLTHIHLDHAGATGALVRRFPDLRVYVHALGAPHLVDPSRLLASATRLYGEDMERLWGEVLPVPEQRIVALRGGETVEGFQVARTLGHAKHHVCYLDPDRGDAYLGDMGGVRIPPSELILLPTPPPEIDLEAWRRSLDTIAAWEPGSLRLAHFGAVDEPAAHLARCAERIARLDGLARDGDGPRFLAEIDREIEQGSGPVPASRYLQAAPPEQLWAGLDRYRRRVVEGGA